MNISYEEFAKLEIRIGTIVSVALVEGADRLLQLKVDVGEETPRQIISGIREFFVDPQVLVGRQCPFLLNLEPRMIRGLESQGMILAGGEGAIFTLLHPETAVPQGTVIH
jgi:methionine--tRNA ligase beta chain